jgi:hypothetical protein
LSRRAPDAADVEWATDWLLGHEAELWRRLDNIDQRHSILVARRFHGQRPNATRAEMAAALLHDVGKLDSGLGTWGRVVASLVGPRTARLRRYHDHEAIGAGWLRAAGSDDVTVQLVSGTADASLVDAAVALRIADDI